MAESESAAIKLRQRTVAEEAAWHEGYAFALRMHPGHVREDTIEEVRARVVGIVPTCLGTRPPYHTSCSPACHRFHNNTVLAVLDDLDRPGVA